MRSMHRAVLLMFATMLCLPAAHGQPVAVPADFTAFSIATAEELPDSDHQAVPLVLESDAGGKTVFSVPGLNALEAISGGSFGVHDQYWLLLGIVPRPGYVITQYQLSGTLSGHFSTGTAPAGALNIRQGGGDSDAYFGAARPYPGNVQIADLQGVQTFDATSPVFGGVPGVPGEILVWGFIHSDAIHTTYDYIDASGSLSPGKAASAVYLSVSDARFTVHWEVVPVPEPSTWLMLVVGLFPLAARMRRARVPRQS